MELCRLLSALVLATALAAPRAARQTEAPADPNELFYRAFYEESARRDFDAAKRLYGEYLAQAGESAPPELVARATAGRARACQALGEVEEALALWRAVLELVPGDEEARAALERAASVPAEERIAAEIRANVERLGTDQQGEASNSLKLYGSLAVPALSAGLRSPRSQVAGACLSLLLELVRQDEAGAIEAVAGALRDPGPLPLRAVVDQVRGLTFSPAKAAIWRAATELPEPELRISVLGQFWSQILRQDQRTLLAVDHEDLLLPLLERSARDPSFLVRRELLRHVGFINSVDRLPPRTRALFVDLVERGLASEVQGEREMALEAAWRFKEVYRAHADEFISRLLEGDLTVGRNSGWLALALEGGWLEPEEVLALLQSSTLAVRVQAWSWLSARRGEAGATPASELAPHAFAAARDWLTTAAGPTRNYLKDFVTTFRGFAFEPGEVAELWRLAHGSVSDRDRHDVLYACLAGTDARDRAERVVGVVLAALAEPAEREALLANVLSLQPVPTACGAFLAAAASADGAALRSLGYRGLLACARRGEALGDMDLPFLAEDVAAWNWSASVLLQALALPAWVDALDRHADEVAYEDARAFVLGNLAAARGGGAVAAAYARLKLRGEPSVGMVNGFLRGAFDGEAPPERSLEGAMAELASTQPALLAGVLSMRLPDPEADRFRPQNWSFEATTRLVVADLRSAEVEAQVQARAL